MILMLMLMVTEDDHESSWSSRSAKPCPPWNCSWRDQDRVPNRRAWRVTAPDEARLRGFHRWSTPKTIHLSIVSINGVPKWMDGWFRGKSIYKWMVTRATPIYGIPPTCGRSTTFCPQGREAVDSVGYCACRVTQLKRISGRASFCVPPQKVKLTESTQPEISKPLQYPSVSKRQLNIFGVCYFFSYCRYGVRNRHRSWSIMGLKVPNCSLSVLYDILYTRHLCLFNTIWNYLHMYIYVYICIHTIYNDIEW